MGRSKQVICLFSLIAVAMTHIANPTGVHAVTPLQSGGRAEFGRSSSGDRDAGYSRDGSGRAGDEAPQGEITREGTRIPPTEGVVVFLGRRWAFVPKMKKQGMMEKGDSPNWSQLAPESGGRLVSTSPAGQPRSTLRLLTHRTRIETTPQDKVGLTHGLSSNSHAVFGASVLVNTDRSVDAGFAGLSGPQIPVTLVATPGGSGSRSSSGAAGSGSRSAGRGGSSSRGRAEGRGNGGSGSRSEDGPPLGVRQWVLAENLMLQRIVKAIRADAVDNQWVLSGVAMEFFGENRMVIRTAQRSNAE